MTQEKEIKEKGYLPKTCSKVFRKLSLHVPDTKTIFSSSWLARPAPTNIFKQAKGLYALAIEKKNSLSLVRPFAFFYSHNHRRWMEGKKEEKKLLLFLCVKGSRWVLGTGDMKYGPGPAPNIEMKQSFLCLSTLLGTRRKHTRSKNLFPNLHFFGYQDKRVKGGRNMIFRFRQVQEKKDFFLSCELVRC